MSAPVWVVESHGDKDRQWSEDACGPATGPGHTQFGSEEEAEEVRQSLIALGEGWTEENTRVRDASSPIYAREAPRQW